MRHRKAGKRLGRKREERVALQRNLVGSLFDQFGEEKEFIVTTLAKAKWVRPFAERCITIGIKGYRELQKAADANGSTIAELRTQHVEEKKKFKDFSPKVREHLSKSIHYRRLALSRLRNPETVRTLFEDVAPRYLDRKGGYLRVLRTNQFNLGDRAPKAILGFVEGPEQEAPASTDSDGEE